MTGRTPRTWEIGLLLLGLPACGDDAESSGGSGGAGGGGSPTASSASASGAGGDGTSSTTTSVGAGGEGGGSSYPLESRGRIALIRGQDPAGLDVDGIASASFDIGPGPDAGCVVELVEACVVRVCEVISSNRDLVGAGTLTVTGLGAPITLEPVDDYYEGVAIPVDALDFAPGDVVTVEASGDEVPAFSVDLVAPGRAVPEPPIDIDAILPRDEDFTLAWADEGGDGEVQLYFVVTSQASSVDVRCDADLADGEVTVPREAMARLPAGEGFAALTTMARDELGAGDFVVSAELGHLTLWSLALE